MLESVVLPLPGGPSIIMILSENKLNNLPIDNHGESLCTFIYNTIF